MGTAAIIAWNIPNTDTLEIGYIHNDGYPEGVGKVLDNHYNTPETITDLFAVGDMSGIGATPAECRSSSGYSDGSNHTTMFTLPDNERGTVTLLAAYGKRVEADYVYLFYPDVGWRVSAVSRLPAFVPVSQAVNVKNDIDANYESIQRQMRHNRKRSVAFR